MTSATHRTNAVCSYNIHNTQCSCFAHLPKSNKYLKFFLLCYALYASSTTLYIICTHYTYTCIHTYCLPSLSTASSALYLLRFGLVLAFSTAAYIETWLWVCVCVFTFIRMSLCVCMYRSVHTDVLNPLECFFCSLLFFICLYLSSFCFALGFSFCMYSGLENLCVCRSTFVFNQMFTIIK